MPEMNLNPNIRPGTSREDFDNGFAAGVRHAVKCIQLRVPNHVDNDYLAIELGRLLELVHSYAPRKEGPDG